MVPAALAVAETIGASGAEVLAAHALGLEIAGKLGRAMGHGHYSRGWHSTATVGAFSCTAAAARLWKLDVKQLRVAWGLAASQMSGLVRNFGTMTKPFHAGHAARTGVLSAWMAKHGFTADESIFDGKNSVLDTYAGEGAVPLSALVDKLGSTWEMTDPGIYVKRWACCYCNHRPIGGLLELMSKHSIKPEEVTAIEIGFPPGSDTALVSHNPVTGLEGSKELLDYSATKGAIHAFTKSLASNLLPKGIRVNAVAPGPVWTPLNPADREGEKVASFGQQTDFKRAAQPEELSPAYVFLASPVCSSYVTGIVLPVTGSVGAE